MISNSMNVEMLISDENFKEQQNYAYLDKFVNKFRAFFWRQSFPILFDGNYNLSDGFGQTFCHHLYQIGPDELYGIEIVTSRRTLHPVDAGRLKKLLREFGRMLRVVILVKAVTIGKVFGYEWHHVLEKNLQVHGGGESAVEYLQGRGTFATNRTPQVQRSLLTRLRGVHRLAFELVQ